MKLRLSQHLKTAVLAAMAAVSSYTYADTTLIAEGINLDNILKSERFYDSGKGYYFSAANYSPYWEDFRDLYKSKGNNLSFLGDLYKYTNKKGNNLAAKLEPLTDDSDTCWAQVSMNMVEYWQSYYGVFCKDSRGALYGYTYDKKYLNELGGTLSLKQSLVFQQAFSNDGDNLNTYLRWYMMVHDGNR